MKPNAETAAICGLFCGTCPCYPQDCHGCLSDRLTAQCAACDNGFRACAKEHKVLRCYACEDFPCARLEAFRHRHYQNGIGHHQTVIADLREMQSHGVAAWVDRQTAAHTCPHCGRLIYWYDRDCPHCK
ncbi:MAG: DUF3795 domain-containing protein [Oscillospiraceae bacterium]